MVDKARRKELVAHFKQTRPPAGVYRIVNTRNNKALLASSTNLPSAQNKFDFAATTQLPGALDLRLAKDIALHGMAAFRLEVLEVLEVKADATDDEVREDLAALEELWREKEDPALRY